VFWGGKVKNIHILYTQKKTFVVLTKIAYKSLKVLIDFQALKVLLI
jgi:hypothetical protein